MKRIIVATDGSPSANRAVAFAAELSRARNAELIIAMAESDTSDEALMRFGETEHVVPGELVEASGRAVLNLARRIAERAGATAIIAQTTIGDPAGFILDLIRDSEAEIAVVGKRGRGRVAGLLLGSVSQKLVSLAPCAVIVVP